MVFGKDLYGHYGLYMVFRLLRLSNGYNGLYICIYDGK